MTIAMVAIVLAIGVPSFRTWVMNTQIRTAAESILNGLQRARAEAVARNTKVEFELFDDTSWAIRLPGAAPFHSRAVSEGTRSVTATPTPADLFFITFNNLGSVEPISLNNEAPFTEVEVDSSVLPAAESREMRIRVGTGGNVRMCDPSLPAGNPRAC